MSIPVIAVSGGPCAGKSTFMDAAAKWLAGYGIIAVVVPEAATILINAGITPWGIGIEAFQRKVLRATLTRIRRYKIAIQKRGLKNAVLLVDRGALDCEAYCGNVMFMDLLSEFGLSRVKLMREYLMVVHLVTAADGAESFYTLDNNAARTESIEQARALDHRSRHAWRGHPHLSVIDNSTDFPTKMQRAVSAMRRVLRMPIPLEQERRFLIKNFNMSFIPADAAKIDIVQTYLRKVGGGIRRVRAETLEGQTMYYYNHKTETGIVGTVYEDEHPPITKDEYDTYLLEKDPERNVILKTRYRFPYADRTFEVDIYESEPWKSRGVVKLEVEMVELADIILIPDEWIVEEVTHLPEWSNAAMAKAA